MSDRLDQIAHLARLHEDSLRADALTADPDAADALIALAGERASQVEQLRDLDRPAGATAAALPPEPHARFSAADCDEGLARACSAWLDEEHSYPAARAVVASILATCRRSHTVN